MQEIQRAKEIFLTDVDEETRDENEQKILEWERDLQRNKAYARWKEHDVTQEINKMAREAFKQHGLTLANNRSLSDEQRKSLWAKQDACLFILSLTDQNAQSAVDSILREIKHALNATS